MLTLKIKTIKKIILPFIILALFGSGLIYQTLKPDAAWPGSEFFKTGLAEGSGIIYVPERGTFFIASDQGRVAEMDKSGAILKSRNIAQDNFEGITYNPDSGLLYLVIEGKDRLLEMDTDFHVRREFSVNRKFEKNTAIRGGRAGFEGAAFVPDKNNPSGGTFFVVNQVTEPNQKEQSAVLEIDFPLHAGQVEAKGRILNIYPLPYPDLSDIFYNPKTDRLLIISDAADTLIEVDRAGQIISTQKIQGKNQEGVTLDGQDNLYIIEDEPRKSTVWRYEVGRLL